MDQTNAAPPPSRHHDDWTNGPAKWLAAVVLGAAAIVSSAWSLTRRSMLAESPLIRQGSAQEISALPEDEVAAHPPAAAPAQLSGSASEKPTASVAKRINVNTANQAELQLLPGIGPSLAARIIEERASHGPFKSIDDLDRVRGIGPKIVERIRSVAGVE